MDIYTIRLNKRFNLKLSISYEPVILTVIYVF